LRIVQTLGEFELFEPDVDRFVTRRIAVVGDPLRNFVIGSRARDDVAQRVLGDLERLEQACAEAGDPIAAQITARQRCTQLVDGASDHE